MKNIVITTIGALCISALYLGFNKVNENTEKRRHCLLEISHDLRELHEKLEFTPNLLENCSLGNHSACAQVILNLADAKKTSWHLGYLTASSDPNFSIVLNLIDTLSHAKEHATEMYYNKSKVDLHTVSKLAVKQYQLDLLINELSKLSAETFLVCKY